MLRPLGTGSVMMFFLLAMAVLGGAEGPIFQFARLIGVIATLGESTSLAAGQALNVTGAIAAAATEVISSATSNGLNAAENAWRGVDVSQLEAHRCAGILTVDGPEVLADWLNGSAALVLIPCLTGALIEQLMAAVTTVSLALPSIQTADESLELLTSFNATKVWAQLLPSGRIQVHYEVVNLAFFVCWANPMWTQFELELGTERDQILRLLRRAVVSLPSPTPASGIQSLDLEVQISWPVLRSKVKMFVRQVVLYFAVLIEDTLRGWGAVSFFMGWVTPILIAGLLLSFIFCVRCCILPPGVSQGPPLSLMDGSLMDGAVENSLRTGSVSAESKESRASSLSSFSLVGSGELAEKASDSSDYSHLFGATPPPDSVEDHE